jgi:hypothetical protein
LLQALREEGINPEEYLFEINAPKGKAAVGKPVTPSKINKEKAENEEVAQFAVTTEEAMSKNGTDDKNDECIDEDELILKDECFEDVEKIGVILQHTVLYTQFIYFVFNL